MKQSTVFMTLLLLAVSFTALNAQPDRWLQRADYKMTIDFDVEKHQFKGQQTINYSNNSPDDLDRIFYHLYLNAFQPGSMMDIRSQTIRDPDPRVGGRISKLKPDEIGYQKIKSLKHNGKNVKYEVVGTVLEVQLNEAIPAGGTAKLEMEFEGQVPLQIRRSGRDNKEGISYSMTQWYPKLSEYDYQGWHANPYIGREFHGVWGNFDVTININKKYIIGASGVLQNPGSIGYGYAKPGSDIKLPNTDKLSWRFLAENVHDFAWTADPDYTHTQLQAKDGPMMHFLFQKNERTEDNWGMLPKIMDEAFAIINKKFGKYPYPVYSFLQGGDGGMEYAMATLITGERSLGSLVGVSVHELMHSWYQMVLGTNESLYAWMDEGFTSYATAYVMNELKRSGVLPSQGPQDNPFQQSYIGYFNLARSGSEEPLTTHADHFQSNGAYGIGSYGKGAIFLNQLEYIIGKPAFDRGMLRYFNTWKFKHPNPNDFIRIMEKESGLELDWYKEYWVNTTHTIDYAVNDVSKDSKKKVKVVLERKGTMPMPIDLVVTMKDGKKIVYHIPLQIMRGDKGDEGRYDEYRLAEDWPWTHPKYELILPFKMKKVRRIEIDPSARMADLDKKNQIEVLIKKP